MNFDAKQLYELLPAFYRLRDIETGRQLLPSEDGGPLKALLSILAEQIGVLEENLDQLYDDQFIETCAEWVVPYIGDLVGARGLTVFPDADFSQRALVANTLTYRRRKGTASVLEQLARDVTGWSASVVEYFQLLATTQYMNHLRPENLSIAPLNKSARLDYLNTPFDKLARTVDVRRIERKRGKYNIPNIGIYLWRIDAYPITNSPAFTVDALRYTFDALGKDTSLYNRPKPEEEITHLAEPTNVPMPISRRVLARDQQDTHLQTYYGKEDKAGTNQSLVIYVNGNMVLPDELTICDLSDLTDAPGSWAHMPGPPTSKNPVPKIALDPVLGRLAFPASGSPPSISPPASVTVSYHYGFSAAIGGGEYGRVSTFSADLPQIVRVPADAPTVQEALETLVGKLNEANLLNESEEKTRGGVIELQNNGYHIEAPTLTIPAGKRIELRSADERRPILVLTGDLTVFGGANAELSINGLLVSGGRIYLPKQDSTGQPNQLHTLQIQHCTLLPGPSPAINTASAQSPPLSPPSAVAAQPTQPRLVVQLPDVEISIEHSVVGSLRVTDQATVSINNSIVDATDPTEVAFSGLSEQVAGAQLTIQNSTIIGQIHTRLMDLASNTIFLASLVLADRLQQGCVRFSYLPPNAKVPRPYHCQPQTAADAIRVRPSFTSLRYGDAGYCQLSEHCAPDIRQGADNGAEMGVFNHLYQPQREANLRARLDEYLPFGLEAGIYYGS